LRSGSSCRLSTYTGMQRGRKKENRDVRKVEWMRRRGNCAAVPVQACRTSAVKEMASSRQAGVRECCCHGLLGIRRTPRSERRPTCASESIVASIYRYLLPSPSGRPSPCDGGDSDLPVAERAAGCRRSHLSTSPPAAPAPAGSPAATLQLRRTFSANHWCFCDVFVL
jgi:hypothetical protein